MSKLDLLHNLENDRDVKTAIADVEAVKKREAELRNKTRMRRFKDTLIEWGRFSSYNGMSHFALADSKPMFVFWFIIVFSSFVAFVYLLNITFRQYLEYKTDVDLDLVYEQSPFPAITICNVNPYKASKLKKLPKVKAFIKWYMEFLEKRSLMNL